MNIASADPCAKVWSFWLSVEGSQMISWTSTGLVSISSIFYLMCLDALPQAGIWPVSYSLFTSSFYATCDENSVMRGYSSSFSS
jgi:hypothetical protein